MIAEELMTASPSVGAIKALPMEIAEIDAHPDRDRIWATIAAVRKEAERQADEAESRAAMQAQRLEGAEDSARLAHEAIRAAIQALKSDNPKKALDVLEFIA